MNRTYDFVAIKQHISITEGAMYLGLKLTESGESLRCQCPACEDAGERSLSILPDKGYFRCFHSDKGGSVIDLVAHVRKINIREAAKWLMEQHGEHIDEAPPPATTYAELPPPLPETKLPSLITEHELVQDYGISPEVAYALGFGYCSRGVAKQRVLFPLYSLEAIKAAGILPTGYVGADPHATLWFPSNLKGGT